MTTKTKELTFNERVKRYEAALIRRALKEAKGSPVRAAEILGMKSHQALIGILNERHKDLLTLRTPIRKRPHKSISKAESIK